MEQVATFWEAKGGLKRKIRQFQVASSKDGKTGLTATDTCWEQEKQSSHSGGNAMRDWVEHARPGAIGGVGYLEIQRKENARVI